MSKKLGVILMFIGAYITLVGGLVWVMHFPNAQIGTVVKPYDWAWGLITAVILVIGTVVAAKPYILGFIGFGISLVGIAGNIWLLSYGVSQEGYLSPLVLTGTILFGLGFAAAMFFHIQKMISVQKHGNTLLN